MQERTYLKSVVVLLIAWGVLAPLWQHWWRTPEVVVEGDRPRKWAEKLSLEGVPNFHRVAEGLYRGAQPTAEGMRGLHEMGIKTVVNLRSFHSDRAEIGETPLKYEHIYMKAWHPEDEEVAQFLRIVAEPANRPVFVHCQHGADRTGTMCATYRMFVEGWTADEAVKEMREGGFGFHEVWEGLPEYLNGLKRGELKIEK